MGGKTRQDMQVARYGSAFYDKDQIGKLLLQKRFERGLLEWYSSNLILSRALCSRNTEMGGRKATHQLKKSNSRQDVVDVTDML